MSNYYLTFSDFLKSKFGQKVYKVTLDAGFSCPNRDGTLSSDGCIFCDDSGSFSRLYSPKLSIEKQLRVGMSKIKDRYHAEKFLAYFQAYTNTYKPVEELKQQLNEKDEVLKSVNEKVAELNGSADASIFS